MNDKTRRLTSQETKFKAFECREMARRAMAPAHRTMLEHMGHLSIQCARAHGGSMQARLKQLRKRRSALLARSAYFTALAAGQSDVRQGVECLRLACDARDMEHALGIISEGLKAQLQ